MTMCASSAPTWGGILLREPTTGVRAQALADVTASALILRLRGPHSSDVVRVYRPQPTLALSARDLRSPGAAQAAALALQRGFTPIVRSAGGRMVAYDSGSVVIDHVQPIQSLKDTHSTFETNAENWVRLLRDLGPIDARVGEVHGEYCPGEFSINVGGVTKVIGSAQRMTRSGSLFSTVVQVRMSKAVRTMLLEASRVLGYQLRESTIGGLTDYSSVLTPEGVTTALREDHASRLGLHEAEMSADVTDPLRSLPEPAQETFHVEDWVRTRFRSSH
jgi:octanoyl-[GcvH]:protein N-octanoyltransferase